MKINEKNLIPYAKSGSQIDREGYLMKKGEGNKNFSKRWFVLKGNLLFYFERKADKEPLGVIIMEGSTIELTDSENDHHYCFKIVFPSRSFTLSADSQHVMENWMKSLAQASYDYLKLMEVELQRQLDELSRDEATSHTTQKLHSSQSFNCHSSLNGNVPPSTTTTSTQTRQHVPTPPSRHRQIRQQKQNNKRAFASLHSEFGSNILRDQTARWSVSETSRPRSGNMAPLSVVKQYSVIDF